MNINKFLLSFSAILIIYFVIYGITFFPIFNYKAHISTETDNWAYNSFTNKWEYICYFIQRFLLSFPFGYNNILRKSLNDETVRLSLFPNALFLTLLINFIKIYIKKKK